MLPPEAPPEPAWQPDPFPEPGTVPAGWAVPALPGDYPADLGQGQAQTLKLKLEAARRLLAGWLAGNKVYR